MNASIGHHGLNWLPLPNNAISPGVRAADSLGLGFLAEPWSFTSTFGPFGRAPLSGGRQIRRITDVKYNKLSWSTSTRSASPSGRCGRRPQTSPANKSETTREFEEQRWYYHPHAHWPRLSAVGNTLSLQRKRAAGLFPTDTMLCGECGEVGRSNDQINFYDVNPRIPQFTV
jgi:hypothetical protein